MSQFLSVSLSDRITDKPPAWSASFASGWRPHELDLDGLRTAIARGQAVILAAMSSEHRSSDAFLHADLVGVDIDDGLSLEDFCAHPLAASALFLYTTASHRDEPGAHRFRVIFRLPRRISDPDHYKAIASLLIRQLGGDRNCTDPCRIFYGNSRGQQRTLAPDSALPESILVEAAAEADRIKAKFDSAGDELDELDILQAEYVLDNVLEPTADGERDRFVRITAAAASAGDALFPAWSNWASRGHHGSGKNARQATERFFRGFSGRSSLATLFFLAKEQDPDWRRSLPPELRKSGSGPNPAAGTLAAGYAHEDFMGSPDDLDDWDPDEAPAQSGPKTQTIFNYDPSTWGAAAARVAAAETTGNPVLSAPSEPETMGNPIVRTEPQTEAGDPGHDYANAGDEDDPGEEYMGSPDDLDDPPDDLPPRRKRGRPRKNGDSGSSSQGAEIKAKIKLLYPDLRLNTLTLQIEYGPREAPQVVNDPGHAYLMMPTRDGGFFPKTTIRDAVDLISWNRRYNPVVEYLESCRQSAKPIDYFDEIATTLLGVPEEGPENPRMPNGELYANVVIRRFLVGAVARALNPGCSHSWMPILIGLQNVGKTNFVRYLTPPHPVDGTYPWSPVLQQGVSYLKDRPHGLHIGWIVLLDEVERYFKRQYMEELKNLISVSTDTSARKFENERSFKRSLVLIGAANSDTFMLDPTGNRRFMPIRVLGKVPSPEDPSIKIVDLDRLKQDRDRIWAAAYRAYLDEPVNEFTSYELAQLEDYVSGFAVDSPYAEAIAAILSTSTDLITKDGHIYTMRFLYEKLGIPIGSTAGHVIDRAISDEMRRLGYESKRGRVLGKQRRFWRKAEERPEPTRKPWDADDD